MATWRVRTDKGLSRRYTVDSLREKLDDGQIDVSAECTQDNGETFVELDKLLGESPFQEATPERSHRRLKKLSTPKSSAGNRLAVPQPSNELTDDDDLFLGSDRLPELPSKGDGRVSGLTPSAVTEMPPLSEAVTQGKDRTNPNQLKSDETETYEVPVPPPKRRPAPDYSSLSLPEDPSADSPQSKTYTLPVPAPSPSPQEFDAPPPSPVAAAAAAALAAEERARKQSNTSTDENDSPEQSELQNDSVEGNDESAVLPGHKLRLSLLWHRPVSYTIILFGTVSVGVILWWVFGRGQTPSLADFRTRSLESSYGDDLSEPMTLPELSSRSRILAIQVNRINRALFREDEPDPEVDISEIQIPPRIPLVQYDPRTIPDAEQTQIDDLLDRYGRMVQEKGPDGRKLDAESVAMYSGYLERIVAAVDGKGPSRTDAVQHLSELCKLIYLTQLPNIRSSDAAARQTGLQALQNATNAGLSKLYVEYSIGDLKFEEIFFRVEPAEQARLITLRYWYHRAVNRATAQVWVDKMISLIDPAHHATVRASIAEVDEIE